MCKLFVVLFAVFFQKAATFDNTFYDDYLNHYRTDFGKLIRSYDRVLDDDAFCNSSEFRMDFRKVSTGKPSFGKNPKCSWDCGPDDPRANRSLLDDEGSVILNRCHPKQSRKASFVSSNETRFETYSGYFQISGIDKPIINWNHFWLFMSQSNHTQSPLIVFLHASPHTSLLAHFLSSNSTIEKLKYSFLFIEYKTQFGYSFFTPSNETDEPSTDEKAIQLQIILDEFFAIFKEFRTVDVYLAGSYEAGKIAEILLFLLDGDHTGISKVKNLKGAIISHGALDTNLMINYASIWSQNGIIDLHTARYVDAHETLGMAVQKSQQYEQLEYFVSNFLQNKVPEIKYVTEREESVSKSIEDATAELLDDEGFKKSHHIGDRNYQKKVSFFGRSTIQQYFYNFTKILSKYKILYCNGQLDNIYTYSMTTEYLRQMQWPGNEKWYHAARQMWYNGDNLIGYWKKSCNLHQVLIRNTGYSVDLTRPKVFLRMVQMFIEDQSYTSDCLY